MSVNNGSSVYNEGGLTNGDVQNIIDNTPNIKNVQSDWNETDNTKYEFIKNKPYFRKYVESSRIFKVCSFAKRATTAQDAEGIDVIYRRGGGAVFGTLLHKVGFELRLSKVDDISVNASTIRFYWVEESGRIQLYANDLAYCNLTTAPICNIPNSRINFDNFGVEVPSLPEGATEITPVWLSSSAGTSGGIPVKVDAYGALTPVTMNNYPISGSEGFVNSGKLYDVFTDDNGDQITETPPQQYYVTGKFYFVAGKVCRCTAYSATSATFYAYGVVEALNYVLGQT